MSQKSHGQEGSAPPSNSSQSQHGKGLSSPALFGGPRTQRTSSPAPPITFNSGGHGASILPCQDPSKPVSTVSDHNAGPALPNNGTHESVLSREPHVERDGCVLHVCQTCTFQSPYLTYSLEELRLKDYSQGRLFGTSPSQNLKAPDSLSWMASESHPAPVDVAQTRLNIQWLLGDVLEIQIKHAIDCPSGCCKGSPQTWHLPKALLSHHSKYLADIMEACTGSKDMPEVEEGRVLLPQEYPCSFTRFVEWLYYGSYTQPSFCPMSTDIDVIAYQLGEKLQAVGFQNYVMARIYKRCDALTPRLAVQAFRNIPTPSPVRKFYLDILGEHFTNSNMVAGSITEWDRIMQEFPDVRIRVLQGVRAKYRPKVKSMAAYMLHHRIRHHRSQLRQHVRARQANHPMKLLRIPLDRCQFWYVVGFCMGNVC